MPIKRVNAAHAVMLHRDKGWPVVQIAAHFEVQKPAIWNAFRRERYFTPAMKEGRKRSVRANFGGNNGGRPRVYDSPPRYTEPRIVPDNREPCPRCGIRGEIGCKHSRAPIGWSVGR